MSGWGSRWSDKWGRGWGRAGKETGDGMCGQAEASNLGLFNFIPADRCLAGQIFHITAVNGAVWRRAGMRMIFRQDQKRSRHSSSPSLLHWSGNDRFHSSYCSWRRNGVQFPGWCWRRWCRTKTRNAALSNSNRRRVSQGKAEESSSARPVSCLRDLNSFHSPKLWWAVDQYKTDGVSAN